MSEQKNYWFPAKRYGWGWGAPTTWQGWVVIMVYMALLLCGVVFFRPAEMLVPYVLYVSIISAALVGVCWLKGKPPAWRWGDKK